MADFLLSDDKGRKYKVSAPDERAAVAAFKKMQASETPDYGSPVLNQAYSAIESFMSPLETFGRKATDMMALNKMDEITALPGAAYDAVFGGEDFGDAFTNRLTSQEVKAQGLTDKNPKSALAGEITGALTGPASQAGAKWVNQGATWLDRALRAAPAAALPSAVAGAEGATLGDRAEGAAYSGAAGLALGPVAQAGGEFVGSQLSKAFNWIRGRGKVTLPGVASGTLDDPVTAAVMQQPGSKEVSRADMESAARELWRRLEADGRDPAKVFSAIDAGQMDERTLASIGGENVKQMIDTAASMPGRAKELVAGSRRAVEQGQSRNIMKAAGQSLGVKQSFTDLEDLIQAQKGAAGPLYDQFYAVSPDRLNTPFMQNFLKNPLSKELLGSARLINQIEKAAGKAPDDVFQYLLDAEGNVSTQQTLNPRAADYVKRALDQKVQDHIDPMTGKIKGAVGKAWDELRRAYLKDVKVAAPEYAAALDAFAGPASMQDAMKVGRDLLKDDWIANRKVIEEMTKGEKEAAKVGLFQAFDDLLGGISNKADKAKRLADVDKYLERAWPLFDSKKSFDAFKKAIASQTAEFQAVQMAGKGSQSAPRLADASMDLENLMSTAVDTARSSGGGDLTMIMRGIKGLMGRAGAAGEGQRAAQAALALTPAKQALPFMSAVRRNADPRALGLLLMSGSPALSTRARGLLARP